MKLLIVEDEDLCRNTLKDLDWKSLGITNVYCAENGVVAYQIAISEKPEIIISDIQMPKMNGIELAEKLSINLPETKIIILTAHNDFSYAQAAISYGVTSYILKPFMDEDVLEAVAKAIIEINEEISKNEYNIQLAEQLKNSKYFLLSYFFDLLSEPSMNESNFKEIFSVSNLYSTCTAMVVSLKDIDKEDPIKNSYKIFKHIIRIFAERKVNVLSFFDTNKLVFFFISDTTLRCYDAQKEVLVCADIVKSYLDFNYKGRYVIGIGESVDSVVVCKTSYDGALDAEKHSFYLGTNSIICITDFENKDGLFDFGRFFDGDFWGYVKSGNCEDALFELKRLFETFYRRNTPIEMIQRVCHEIFVHLAICVAQCGHDPSFIFDKTNPWEIIRKYDSFSELEKFILNFVESVVQVISTRYDKNSQDLIKSIKEYISIHPDTSLNDIADRFFHSPNYLSSVFSKTTGVTIKSYIISERMRYSKELLANPYININEVATRVGYKTVQHFSTVFNKYVGVTPSSFRAKTLGKG